MGQLLPPQLHDDIQQFAYADGAAPPCVEQPPNGRLVGQKGIRCCYHGWLFDVDGTILEIPGEPANSTLKDRLFHGAYPVHEAHGIVFAYLGPPEKQPAFSARQPKAGFTAIA